MRAIAALTAVAAIPGCLTPPDGARPLTAAEAVHVAEVMSTWAETEDIPPTGGECAEELPELMVVMPSTDDEMFELTGLCGPYPRNTCQERMVDGECRWGCAWSSYTRYRDSIWPFGLASDSPLLVVWADEDPARVRAMFQHESAHWLEECSGHGIDYSHEPGLVWGPNGVVRRARAQDTP